MIRVGIKPELLQWACQRSGIAADAIAHRFPQFHAWISKGIQPTLKQVEQFAKATYTPVGFLFLQVPPVEHVPIPDFRRVANKERVLLVCIHNSGRSQVAEALLRQLGGDRFEAESAGFEPGNLNPIVVTALKEIGIDISQAKTKSVFDLFKQGRLYQYVVTVCDESSSERCPIFPGLVRERP